MNNSLHGVRKPGQGFIGDRLRDAESSLRHSTDNSTEGVRVTAIENGTTDSVLEAGACTQERESQRHAALTGLIEEARSRQMSSPVRAIEAKHYLLAFGKTVTTKSMETKPPADKSRDHRPDKTLRMVVGALSGGNGKTDALGFRVSHHSHRRDTHGCTIAPAEVRLRIGRSEPAIERATIRPLRVREQVTPVKKRRSEVQTLPGKESIRNSNRADRIIREAAPRGEQRKARIMRI